MSERESRSNPDQYMLRLPPGMRVQLSELAKAGNRSLNSEIIRRLQASLGLEVEEVTEGNPSDSLDRIMVRLPDGVRDLLNTTAKRRGRSVNAEVVLAIRYWLKMSHASEEPEPPIAENP